ncbi:MAG: class I SAM-dependent methyltransferase [Methylococcales bacterium]|nr:hypothetical protein [Methylococcaceae bacterium]
MNAINPNEIEFSSLSNEDDVGRVFFWKNRVFRAIYKEKVEHVSHLFTSGLINALIEENVFVHSEITEFTLDGFGLVIEHQLAEVVTYPHEWSFSMLKNAANAALKLNIIASTYGYQTKDIHPYNILFFGVTPKYIDLGSFTAITKQHSQHLYAFEEFSKCYTFPLKIWARGDTYTARRFIQRWKFMPSVDAYIAYRLGGRLGLLRGIIFKCWKTLYQLQKIPHVLANPDVALRYQKYRNLFEFLTTLKLPLTLSNMAKLLENVKNYALPTVSSTWGNYQATLYLPNDAVSLSERLQKIHDAIKALNPDTVTDLAGNQGVLSQAILESGAARRVMCVDYDDEAIEQGYLRILKSGINKINIHFAVINPFYPEVNKFESPPESRFKSDMVLALALTHHLILTQGYNLNYIFSVIKSYSNNYVAIEFMPLGLFDSVTKEGNPPPEWYTEAWFKAEFENHFSIIEIINLEINRVIFIGKKLA